MSADQSIIDLTNETQEELQNETQDDIEIVGQNLKCNDNDAPIIYCNQASSQTRPATKRRRTGHPADEDVFEILVAPPTHRARLGSSQNRRHVNRTGRISLTEPERLPASLPVSVPIEDQPAQIDVQTQTLTRSIVNVVQNLPPVPPIISPGFECPICLEKHKDNLVSTICGHIFCKPCLKESMKTVKQCPKCRKKITVKSFHSIFI